jgi:2-phospho-L-lactate guanylyltransferase
MQATVATYDPQTRSGTVLLDDGSELAFDGDAFAQSGLRLLRLGQRVALSVDAQRRVIALILPTMPGAAASQS